MSPKRDALHIVSTEALLWALGGFAKEAPVRFSRGLLSPLQIAAIRKLAAKARTGHGEGREVAERVGLGWKVLEVLVYRVRRRGYSPAYWG